MRFRARKFVIFLTATALALANGVSARHALATMSHYADAAPSAQHDHGSAAAGHSHSHDVAPKHADAEHDAAGSTLADQGCCAAWCAGAALIFGSAPCIHAAAARDFRAATARAIVLTPLNSLDPPPR